MPRNVPIILEACIDYAAIDAEIARAAAIFDGPSDDEVISQYDVAVAT